ncbi:DUF4231 domain-containing protein [Nocardia sp. bgisy118]|uniref:DUF4231 domain-containing protein n=1 Tax=Nocardia sp. bgisy118 TaxID=3413786 RepID=UPI003F49BC05
MLRAEDYPGLFRAADEAAVSGERSFLRTYALRLWLALFAAACAAITVRVGAARTDIAAIATALAFVGILTIDVNLLQSLPGRTWHEGRVLAESVKTLTWRYAVCGAPFDGTLAPAEADALLIERIRRLHHDLPDIAVRPTTSTTITDRMRELRRLPHAERRQEYICHRIQEQQRWYADKSAHHDRRGARLRTVALLLEIGGVSAALAKAINVIGFDLAGIIAAGIAGIAAWTSARRDNRTAAVYAFTSNELAIIADTLRDIDETRWATAVSGAEETISREHTVWRAFHTE